MDIQQCIDFLVDRVGHERPMPRVKFIRFVLLFYSPLVKAYMIGQQFYALKKNWLMGKIRLETIPPDAVILLKINACWSKRLLTI